MNTETTQPTTVPMRKEETVKDDGRFLIYYTFPDGDSRPAATPTPPAQPDGGR